VVQGNYIGTDATGTVALGNTLDGVFIGAGSNSIVGGSSAAARNVISGNGGHGVELFSTGTSVNRVEGNRVEGNRIGVAANGSALGNGGDGVRLTRVRGNRVGGTAPGAGNVIANNGGAGVRVGSGTGNAVLGNRIFDNGGLGIDLGPAGVTPNDFDDPDIGANRLFNFPLLYVAHQFFVVLPYPGPGIITQTVLRVRGSINTETNKTLRIEFFASPAADPSGHGEGTRFLGAATVATGGCTNTASFNVLLPLADDLQGQVVTATATDELGNTSEFSAALAVALAVT
jgi:titin